MRSSHVVVEFYVNKDLSTDLGKNIVQDVESCGTMITSAVGLTK